MGTLGANSGKSLTHEEAWQCSDDFFDDDDCEWLYLAEWQRRHHMSCVLDIGRPDCEDDDDCDDNNDDGDNGDYGHDDDHNNCINDDHDWDEVIGMIMRIMIRERFKKN